jgi:reactive chlorine resistance protein C
MTQTRHSSEPAFLRSGSSAEVPGPAPRQRLPRRVVVTAIAVRYALAAVVGYLGALKISPVAAQLIEPVVANSAALAWLYSTFSVEGAARAIAAVELVTALFLLASPFAAWLAVAGSLLAVGVFVTTLSFLVTTPGIFMALPGFPLPAPSTMGAFLAKDVFLLAAAAWSLIVALRAMRRSPRPGPAA